VKMRNLNAYLLGFTLPFLLAWCVQARADDDYRYGDDITNTEVETIVTNELGRDSLDIAGDRAFAIGQGSFDVDINQCLASKAMSIIIVGWQTLEENATCIADGLDARGNHDAAARVRCKHVKTIYSAFETFDICIDAVTMVGLVDLPVIQDRDDHDEDDSHQQEVRELQQQLVVLIEEQRTAATAANKYAVQQRREKQADREYAQQLIEEIRQIEEPPNE